VLLHTLAVRTAEGVPAVFLVNQDFVPVDVSLQLTGADVASYPRMSVTRAERGRLAERGARPLLRQYARRRRRRSDRRARLTCGSSGRAWWWLG